MNDFIANYMAQPSVHIFTGNEDDSIFDAEPLARHEWR